MIPRSPLLRETPNGWQIQAPAKVNLYLHVRSKRPDGFHEVETLIAPLRLADTLLLRQLPPESDPEAISLRVHQPATLKALSASEAPPSDERNLVFRALQRLREQAGVTAGVSAELWKRIPSEAGLGGGSSDAAAALVAGQRLWRRDLPEAELFEIAAGIGSDVPFFLENQLRGGAAVCRGRGERVEPVRVPAGYACVLVKPPVGLGAGEVYAHYRPPSPSTETDAADRLGRLIRSFQSGALREAGRWMKNQLQKPASLLTDWVERLASAFDRLPVAAHQLTGSGSVYFGLCENQRVARLVASTLRHQRLGWVAQTAIG